MQVIVVTGPWLIYHVKSAKAFGLLPIECGDPSREIVLDVAESEAADTTTACQRENAPCSSQRECKYIITLFFRKPSSRCQSLSTVFLRDCWIVLDP